MVSLFAESCDQELEKAKTTLHSVLMNIKAKA